MVCKCINAALKKFGTLADKIKETSPSLYETLGPYVKEKTAKEYLDTMVRWTKEATPQEVALFPQIVNEFGGLSPFYVNAIRIESLRDYVLEMIEILRNCKCETESAQKYVEKTFKEFIDPLQKERDTWVNKHNNLEEKCRKLEEKVSDLDDNNKKWEDDYKKLEKEFNDKKIGWRDERSEIETKKVRLEEQLKSSKGEETRLTKDLEITKEELKLVRIEKDTKVGALKVKLDQEVNKIQELEKEKVEKDSELKEKTKELERKEEEIKLLKNQAGLSQEELLVEKLRFEKRNLEIFAIELRINLEQINNLIRYHERLFQAQKNHSQDNIATHDDNIFRIKQELLDSTISIVNIQEICGKCEKIAELRWELEQMQQQYETHQEVPTA